jgi:hypothetical protein
MFKPMQLRSFIIAGVVSLIAFTSCNKKDNVDSKEISIEGTWVGKYSFLSEPYNNYYSFKIKPGGTLELLNEAQQKTGEGTWETEPGIFSATYTLLPPSSGTFSVIANFNKTNKIDGTWGVGQQLYGGGYWYMNKIN